MTIFERIQASSKYKWPWATLLISVIHLALVEWRLGIRIEHVLLDLLLIVTAWWGGRGIRFSFMVFPVWCVGATYELSSQLMFLQGDRVHIEGIYQLEKLLFGINAPEGRVILSEYFTTRNWPWLDVFCGFFYSYYFWHIILLPMLWVFTCPERQARMAWSFLTANFIGLCIFLLFPVAPPWYVAAYGFDLVAGVKPSAAGAARFDAFFGIHYFENFYKHNATVFGAFPSLHVGYPFSVAMATLGYKRGWQIFCFAVPACVGFSAFYLQHHYILDVFGGMAVGVLSFAIVVFVLHRKQWDGTLRGYFKLWTTVPSGYKPPYAEIVDKQK